MMAINVYRGQDGVIDYETPVTVMDDEDTQAVIEAQDLPANTIWHYVRKALAECGLESDDSPVCIVRIDADGEMILDVPNTPEDVEITPQAGGKFLLRWRYNRAGEEISPTGFHIYADSGEGFDFEEPAGTVAYSPGQYEYAWLSGAYPTNQRCKFCIRSYAEDGGESQNTDYASGIADATGPDAITGLYATIEQI